MGKSILISLGIVCLPVIYWGLQEFRLYRKQKARNQQKLAEFNQLCEEIKAKRLEA